MWYNERIFKVILFTAMVERVERGSIADVVPGLVLPLARYLYGSEFGRYSNHAQAAKKQTGERLN